MIKFIFLLGIFLATPSWGNDAVGGALLKIEEIQKALRTLSQVGAPLCDPKIPSTCNFQNFCSALSPNRTKAYIYEDKAGRKFANYNLLFLQDQLELCLAANGRVADRHAPNETDPFANPHLLMGEGSEKHRAQFKQEESRVRLLGEDIKKNLVDLLAKRRNSRNAAMIDNMIARVRRVRWEVVLPNSPEELFESGCYLPNARFKPPGNAVSLCPQMLGIPEGTLTMILAHELGHAIDPCMVSNTIIEMNGEEWVLGRDGDGMKSLVASVPAEKNPLDSVIQCLQSPQSLGVQIRNKTQKAKELRSHIAGLVKEGVASSPGDLIAAQNKLREYEDPETPEDYCAEGPNDSGAYYLQEAFSDWVAAEVLAERMRAENDAGKNKAFVFESQLLGLQSECAGFSQEQKEMISKQVRAAGCKPAAVDALFSLDQARDVEDHPSWSRRMSKIYLAKPELQKALRCQPDRKSKSCE